MAVRWLVMVVTRVSVLVRVFYSLLSVVVRVVLLV